METIFCSSVSWGIIKSLMVFSKSKKNFSRLVFETSEKFWLLHSSSLAHIPKKKISMLSSEVTTHTKIFPQKVGSQALECSNHDISSLRVQENHKWKSSHGRNFFHQTFRKPDGERTQDLWIWSPLTYQLLHWAGRFQGQKFHYIKYRDVGLTC